MPCHHEFKFVGGSSGWGLFADDPFHYCNRMNRIRVLRFGIEVPSRPPILDQSEIAVLELDAIWTFE